MNTLLQVVEKKLHYAKTFKNTYFKKRLSFVPYSTNAKEQKVTIEGQTINFVRVGTGSKNILCFPGAVGSIWSDFKPQIEKLDRSKFTVIAWDPPGYGYSRPPNRNFSVDFYHEDAEMAQKLMKEIGINKYSLVGWSDGGISSMILAAKYSGRIESLVVWGSNAYIIAKELEIYEAIRDINKWSEKMREPLIKMYGEELFRTMWNDWIDTVTALYKEKDGNICKELLNKIQCPTLIVHGAQDPMIATEHPAYLSEHIKNAQLFIFPKGKHNLHLRYADEFNDLITKFITSHATE